MGSQPVSDGPRNFTDLIVRHEGFRALPYCDRCGEAIVKGGDGWFCDCRGKEHPPGNLTILYGLNLDRNPLTMAMGRALVALVEPGLREGLVLERVPMPRDPVRYAALMDLAYNLGVNGLERFVRFLGAVQLERWDDAARELRDSLAFHQEPRRIEELARMFTSGEWPTGNY